MNEISVEVRNLSYIYPDGNAAINNVSFCIAKGESVAIIGANGAGKSTLLQHLNGGLRASSGDIIISNKLLSKSTIPEIRRSVGMVFQNPDDQLFMPTVYDDVAFGPLNQGVLGKELDRVVSRAMKHTGTEQLRHKPPYHLSGGEKKRVAIASVLAMSPDILVMDEPTSGLDPYSRRQLIALFSQFCQTRIFTSHDLDMVLDLCPRTIILHEGSIMADGLTEEIFRDETLLASCRLEKPFVMQGCPICSKF